LRHLLGAATAAGIIALFVWACGKTSPTAPSNAALTSVAISGTTPAVGTSAQFTATANFSNATNQNVTAQAAWQSSSSAVATVSSAGLVTAAGSGDADIRATYQSQTGTMHITVAAPTFTLLGVVSQTGSSTPVQGAAVRVLDGPDTGRATSTDDNGFYNIGGLRGGSFTLEALKTGYVLTEKSVTLTSDLRFDFTLTPIAPPAPSPPPAPQCNSSLWSHVYDPSRLSVVDSCRTVTGTITDQHTNDDGDIDVRLAVDPPYTSLLNGGNISNLSGHLQTEAICQAPITVPDAARACSGLKGSVAVPANGTHVQVTGVYLLDKIHGWMEIHPISVLRVIP